MQILTSPPTPQFKARVASPTLQPRTEAVDQSRDVAVLTSAGSVETPRVDQGQARRISKFVQETKEKGAHNLRGMAGMMAGQLTGMTIGSLIFAPLAFHYGNLYIATGGAAITGGALALLGHKLASREVSSGAENSTLANLGVAAGGLAKSLPSFVYPTVAGATVAEKAIIYGALDALPLSGVTSAPTIDVVTGLQKSGASGLATPLFSQSRIFLDRNEMAYGADWAQEVTTHEIGHTFDFSKGVGPILNRSQRGGGFGKAPFVSEYAGTNRMEDYAEGYANYHRTPDQLLKTAPAKYEVIADSQQPGLVDKAVDRPSVRDAGKRVGSAFESAPYLRNFLALGSSLISPFQVYRGATNLERGLQSGDQKTLFDGKMQLASGSALLSGVAPLGLALTLGHVVAGKLLEDGSITPDQANAFADTSLAISTGPVGFAAASIEEKLDKAGLLDGGGRVVMFAPMPSSKSGQGTALAGGFAIGAVAGGLLSPFLMGGSAASVVSAAAGGSWIGGLAGAALGVGAHYLATKQDDAPRLGLRNLNDKLTGDDKKLLAKLIAPTVVGGVGGAVLGGMAGDYLGQALGQAVAGAAGGVTGAVVGRYVGILGGSFAMVKGGSALGAKWAGLTDQKASS